MSNQQVTYRGCSKAFILCALHNALVDCRSKHQDGTTVSFPFAGEDIKNWLESAKRDCHSKPAIQDLQVGLGGIDFEINDSSSYWTTPQHFNNW